MKPDIKNMSEKKRKGYYAEKGRKARKKISAEDAEYFTTKHVRTHFTPTALQHMTPEKFAAAVSTPGFVLTIKGNRNHR